MSDDPKASILQLTSGPFRLHLLHREEALYIAYTLSIQEQFSRGRPKGALEPGAEFERLMSLVYQ